MSGRNLRKGQSGVVLIVGLILLIVLTLLGISAINVSTLNLRNVRNMQYRQTVLDVSQQAIEFIMSSANIFVVPADTPVTVKTPQGDYAVTVKAPYCIGSSVRAGSQLGSALGQATFAIKDTYWDVRANTTDTQTGASVEVHQGVMVPMAADCK